MIDVRAQVKEVSHDSKIAKLQRMDVDWITSPRYGVVQLLGSFEIFLQGFHVRL